MDLEFGVTLRNRYVHCLALVLAREHRRKNIKTAFLTQSYFQNLAGNCFH